MLCFIDTGDEVLVSESSLLYQINFPSEKRFKRITEIKEIPDIIKFRMVNRLKIDKQIHVALVIEPVGKYRSKHRKSLNLMLTAKVKYPL